MGPAVSDRRGFPLTEPAVTRLQRRSGGGGGGGGDISNGRTELVVVAVLAVGHWRTPVVIPSACPAADSAVGYSLACQVQRRAAKRMPTDNGAAGIFPETRGH